jgi:hypothetical protein
MIRSLEKQGLAFSRVDQQTLRLRWYLKIDALD